METHEVLEVVHVLVIVGIAAVIVGACVFARNLMIKRKLVCPHKEKEMNVEFVCGGTEEHATPLSVHSCSAFTDPKKVDCDQKCVESPGLK